MPRYRPPFLVRDVSRHGTVRWYYRRNGKRVRLPAYGSEVFQAAYDAAVRGDPVEKPGKVSLGTLAWLVERYKETSAWAQLSTATHRQRDNIFKRVIANAGNVDYTAITQKVIEQGLEDRASTPAAAKNFLDTMRGLFRWASKAGHVETDPTANVKAKRPKTEGFAVWTDDDCAAFETKWPLGTRERLAYAILAYTGLRRGDAVTVGRQHIKDGTLTLRTEKTGEVVTIPVLPELVEAIQAGPCGDLTFLVTEYGRGFVKEGFGNWFKRACMAAGVDKSAHGLRKYAATRLADAGATVAQLEAWFGWRGGNMASLYTRKADRKRLAKSAAGLLAKG